MSIDFNSSIQRLKKAASVKFDREIAELIGFSGAAFSERKKRGTLPKKEIEVYCLKNSINVDWVFAGVGPMRLDATSEKPCDTSDSKTLFNGETEDSVDYWKERCLNLHEENSVLRGENKRLRKKAGEPEIEIVKRQSQGGQ